MKAAVYVGDPKSLALEELKPNPPGPRDVVVEIGASGVCHSDLSIMRGYVPVPPGMVLAMGDHRGNSNDGRMFGFVDERELVGRAIAIYYRRGEGFVWKPL